MLYRTGQSVRSDVVWNTAASMVFALQSYFMLWLVQFTSGAAYAGIFSFAAAQAFLFWSVGCFGMRRFQASDVRAKFTFADYVMSRIVTVGAMIVTCAVFLVVQVQDGGLDRTKTLGIILLTALKVVDALEDVFMGHLQQRGFLFVAGRMSTIRSVAITLVFGVGMVAGIGLIRALVVSGVVSLAVLTVLAAIVLPGSVRSDDRTLGAGRIFRLLVECLPLLVYAVLAMYLTNAPKYAIEAGSVNKDLVQAEFGFLITPAFVIGLVSAFIYNPMILPLARLWANQLYRALARQILRIGAAIAGLSIIACLVGYPLGPPLLSWLFRVDLHDRGWQFTALLASGGLLALAGFEVAILTVIRQQLAMSIANGVVTVGALSVGSVLVRRWALDGACALALGIAGAQCVLFAAILVGAFARERHRMRETTESPTPDLGCIG